MFTGIVSGLVAVKGVKEERDLSRIELDLGELAGRYRVGRVGSGERHMPNRDASHGQQRGEL